MKPTEYPLRPGDPESHWCLARHNLLAKLEAEGYRFYREGEVPEWFEPSVLTAFTSGDPIYRNTKEQR